MEESTKKRKEDQMIDRRKKIRRDQFRPWMGRDVKFVDEFTNQQSVLHMGRNATSAKRRITDQAVVRQRKYTKHLQSLIMIL